MSAPAEPAIRRAEASGAEGSLRDSPARLLGLLDRPLTSYYLILGCTLLLLGLGLAMVLSTSTAYALDHHLPTYAAFQKQLLGAVGGLGLAPPVPGGRLPGARPHRVLPGPGPGHRA
jgi:cell division protein FtsW